MASSTASDSDVLRTPFLEIYLQGAHLTACSLPWGNPLFLSNRANFAPGRSIRGGIPIIFPWFGDAQPSSGLGPHGFARTAVWQVLEQSPDGRSAALELRDDANTRAQWPHSFQLVVRFHAGDVLSVALEVTNTGSEAFDFEAALHTYLAVEEVRDTRVHGLEGATYLDKVDSFAEKLQDAEPIRFPGEVDRVYPSNRSSVRVEASGSSPGPVVTKQNSNSTIIWNPGSERALAMADLGSEWNRFVCVESGNMGSNRIRLAPSETHRMDVTLGPA